MSSNDNQIKHLKREILVRITEAFLSNNFEDNTRKIPYVMRPKGCEVDLRCCVYKERAVLRDRIVAGLGHSIENDDECKLLSEYAKEATERQKPDDEILTVLQGACKGCVPSSVYVTDMCQGCVARPCTTTCRFGAISIVNGRSHIDSSKCKNCGMCINACPYSAIAKIIVPCESVCPVDAIKKDESGHARIDFSKCIGCGKCIAACPFGAIHEKSQIIDVLSRIKEGKNVIAMIAPAVAGQFPYPMAKVRTALLKIGFKDVLEVAQGADITTLTEAEDFKERMAENAPFMTTSCCAAYNELVKKHIPEIKPYVSETGTPLYYTAEIAKKKDPDCVTVFISPCSAKRKEVLDNPNADYVINFDELGAILVAMKIEVSNLEDTNFEVESSKEGRNFPISGGVAQAVKSTLELKGENVEIHPCLIDGLNKQTIRELKGYAKTGNCPNGNLIEVMSCSGGCVGGNSALNAQKKAQKQITEYADTGKPVVQKEATEQNS